MRLPLMSEVYSSDIDVDVVSMSINTWVSPSKDIQVNFPHTSDVKIHCVLDLDDNCYDANNSIKFIEMTKDNTLTGQKHTIKGFIILDTNRNIIALYTLEYAIGKYTFIAETNQVLWKEKDCIFLYDVIRGEKFYFD